MDKNETKKTISAEDVIFFSGLALFFAGLWLWQGLPVALTSTGATMMLAVAYLLRTGGSQ